MSIGSLTLDFLHSRYKCTTVLLTKISPVAALPVNTKRPTLMKASFQRADLFLSCAALFSDAVCVIYCLIIFYGISVQVRNVP